MKSRNTTLELINNYKLLIQEFISTQDKLPTPNEVFVLLLRNYLADSGSASARQATMDVISHDSQHRNFAAELCNHLQNPEFNPLELLNNYLSQHQLEKTDFFSLLIAYFDYYKITFKNLSGYENLQNLEHLKRQIIIPISLLNKKITNQAIELIFSPNQSKLYNSKIYLPRRSIINTHAVAALCGMTIPIKNQARVIDGLMPCLTGKNNRSTNILDNIRPILSIISKCEIMSADTQELERLGVSAEWKTNIIQVLIQYLYSADSDWRKDIIVGALCETLSKIKIPEQLKNETLGTILKSWRDNINVYKHNIDYAAILNALVVLDVNNEHVSSLLNSLYEKLNCTDNMSSPICIIMDCNIPSKYLDRLIPIAINLLNSDDYFHQASALTLLTKLNIPLQYIDEINERVIEKLMQLIKMPPKYIASQGFHRFSGYFEMHKIHKIAPETLQSIFKALLANPDLNGKVAEEAHTCLAQLPLPPDTQNTMLDKLLIDIDEPFTCLSVCRVLKTFPIPPERTEAVVDSLMRQLGKTNIFVGNKLDEEIYFSLSKIKLPDSKRAAVIELMLKHSRDNLCLMDLTIAERQMITIYLLTSISDHCKLSRQYGNFDKNIGSQMKLLVNLYKNSTPNEYAALKAKLEHLQNQHPENDFLPIALTSCIHQMDNDQQVKQIMRIILSKDIASTIRKMTPGRI